VIAAKSQWGTKKRVVASQGRYKGKGLQAVRRIMPIWCVSEMFLAWVVLGLLIAFVLGMVVAIVRW
jgi:hypothetical protein